MPKPWFQNWFGSPYYHLLYSERNTGEAAYFINNLLAYLSGFKMKNHFSNYNLEKFDAETSDRLIFICQKTNV